MIPKKIHYCWLSGDPLPPDLEECLDSWRNVMPDYELVLWDTNRFDIDSVPFVREATSVRRWAFAADYIRLFAVYSEGGIYLDSDVRVNRRFDDVLGHHFFTSVEYHPNIVAQHDMSAFVNADGSRRDPSAAVPGIGLQAAIFGGVAGNPLLGDCLDYYRDRHFILPDGQFDTAIIAPGVYAAQAEKYGFRYRDEKQELDGDMVVFPSEVFAGHRNQETPASVAVHLGVGSWKDAPRRSVLRRIQQIPDKLRRARP